MNKHKLLQLDSNFKIVSSFKNISYVDKESFDREKIINCCNFKAITHKGFHWMYEEMYDDKHISMILAMKNKKPKDVTSKVVYQLDANKNIVHTYKNSKEASDITGIKKVLFKLIVKEM